MLNFIFHPRFSKEAAGLERRFPFFSAGLDSFKRICEVHFDPLSPRQVIAPAKLHRVKYFNDFTIWKIELAVKNLRANQFPRIWFAVRGATVVFLCIATHIDNYRDDALNKESEILAASFFN